MYPFSWVQFNPLMGQKMGQKWVRKNEALKKVQKIRRFHQKSADFCHVLIKKMHGLRDSLVTSVGFSFHYFHVLRLDFALFIFDR